MASPVPFPPSMPTVPPLIVRDYFGADLQLTNESYEMQAESGTYAAQAERVLFSNRRFLVGDGGFDPDNLRLSVLIRPSGTNRAKVQGVTDTIEHLKRARTLFFGSWQRYYRPVLGIGGNRTKTYIEGGVRLEIEFIPVDEHWIESTTGERVLGVELDWQP